jgi:hypothetical protein
MYDSNINLNDKNKVKKLNIIKLSNINYFESLTFNRKYYIFKNIIKNVFIWTWIVTNNSWTFFIASCFCKNQTIIIRTKIKTTMSILYFTKMNQFKIHFKSLNNSKWIYFVSLIKIFFIIYLYHFRIGHMIFWEVLCLNLKMQDKF